LNGFLNGQAIPFGGNSIDALIVLPPLTATATFEGLSFPLTASAELPVGGLLTPLSPVFLSGGLGPVGGTQIGGLIPGLLSFGPELAAAITPIG
jgi:hypothetical protein